MLLGLFAAFFVLVSPPAQAGTVWLAGSAWLGGGGCDVYSYNSSDVDQRSYYNGVDVGLKWQCVELPGRLYTIKGWRSGHFPNANQIYPSASSYGLTAHANGSGYVPVPGDMVTWDVGTVGHVAVVDYVDSTKVHIVEQNFSSTCKKTMTRSGTNGSHVERDDGWGYGQCQGFVHSPKNGSTGDVDGAQMTAENYPDGTVLSPGRTFTKTFTIKNTGTTTWVANGVNGYTLNHTGDVPASPNLGAAYQTIPTVNVAPGESCVFSIALQAPSTPGSYEADFQMSSANSVYFGPKIWVKIVSSLAPGNLYWDINGTTAGAGGTAPGGAWTSSFWSASATGTNICSTWVANSDAFFSAGADATGFFKVTGIPNTSWKSVTVEQGKVQLEGSYVTNNGTGGTSGTTLMTVASGAYLSMTNSPGIYLAGKGITKRGPGGINVGGNEYYNGPTYIEEGTVTIVSDLPGKQPFGIGVAGSANAIIHLGGGTLSAGVPIPANGTMIYLTNQYVLSLEGGAIEVGSAGTQFTIAAKITGSGSLIKEGTGTLTLSQSNTYSGGTFINHGTLVVNANGGLGTDDVQVGTGGKLSLKGSYFNRTNRLHLDGTALVTNAAANTAFALSFDGGTTYKRAGTWGSSTSGATYQDNTRLVGTGKLTVAHGPGTVTTLDSPDPVAYGQPVIFTARIDSDAGTLSGAGTPTGMVTFYDDGVPIGSPAMVTAGVATVTNVSLVAGSHAITSNYSGDTTFAASAATAETQMVHNVQLSVGTCLDGNCRLTFSGIAGVGYSVRASTNVTAPLSAWDVLATNLFTGSSTDYIDLTATNYPKRFYLISIP